MPNEQIKCPNCGSGDVQALVADSYTCEHCQTDFRWVNPSKSTVVHEQKLCACGNVATAFCVRCHEPLCKGHRRWHHDAKKDYGDQGRASSDYTEQARKCLGEYGDSVNMEDIRAFVGSWGQRTRFGEPSPNWKPDPVWIYNNPGWHQGLDSKAVAERVKELLKQRGVDVSDNPFDISVFCGKCMGADWKAWGEVLEEVFTSFHHRIVEGLICTSCLSDKVAGRCQICGRVFCSFHLFPTNHQCARSPEVKTSQLPTIPPKQKTSPSWLDKLLKKVGLR